MPYLGEVAAARGGEIRPAGDRQLEKSHGRERAKNRAPHISPPKEFQNGTSNIVFVHRMVCYGGGVIDGYVIALLLFLLAITFCLMVF